MKRTATIVAAAVLGWTALAFTTAPAHAASGCDAQPTATGGGAYCATLAANENARAVITCRTSAGQTYTAYGVWVSGGTWSIASCSSSSHDVASYWGQLRQRTNSWTYVYSNF